MVNKFFDEQASKVTQDAILRLADRAFIIVAVVYVGAIAYLALSVSGIVITQSGVVGGDFLAFYTAGEFALSGDALGAYDQAQFDDRLKTHAPLEALGMMWQYPPTVFFIVAPFALLPYKASYLAWCIVGWAALVLSLRSVGFRGRELRLLALSPLCLNVLDNGQISLLTAALLILASFDPKQKWLIAGIAAGLLTVKPQLGILLPIAYVAVGAWRTIFVAAATALVLHMPSFAAFGVEGWRSFFFAVARLSADYTGLGIQTPPQGMTTLFGQLRILGAPSDVATIFQYLTACVIAVGTAVIWRRPGSALSKAALLCVGAVLVSPYSYGYEMAALLLAAVYIVRHARWPLSSYSIYLAACWGAIILSTATASITWLNIPFIITASAFMITLRIILAKSISMPAVGAPA